jgi:hypothetical protein
MAVCADQIALYYLGEDLSPRSSLHELGYGIDLCSAVPVVKVHHVTRKAATTVLAGILLELVNPIEQRLAVGQTKCYLTIPAVGIGVLVTLGTTRFTFALESAATPRPLVELALRLLDLAAGTGLHVTNLATPYDNFTHLALQAGT